jgi:small subunit ribosomal protein S1
VIGQLNKGAVVTCTVSAIVDGGIEVKVRDVVPGFIRNSELSRDRSEQRPDRFAPGEKIDAKITQIDKSSRRLQLSIKAREVEEEKKAMATYGSSDAGASLGDILGAAIQEKRKKTGEKSGTAKGAGTAEDKSAKKTAKKKDDDRSAAGDDKGEKKAKKKAAPKSKKADKEKK